MTTTTLMEDDVIDLFDGVTFDTSPENLKSKVISPIKNRINKLFKPKRAQNFVFNRDKKVDNSDTKTVTKFQEPNNVTNNFFLSPTSQSTKGVVNKDQIMTNSVVNSETQIDNQTLITSETVDLLTKESNDTKEWREIDMSFKDKVLKLWESGFKKVNDNLEDIDDSTKRNRALAGGGLFGGKGKGGLLKKLGKGGLLKSGLRVAGVAAGAFGLSSAASGINRKRDQSFLGGEEGEGGFFQSRAAEHLKGAGSGALAGLQIGALFGGPIGAAIGAAVGGIGGLLVTGFVEFKDEIIGFAKDAWDKFKKKPVDTIINALLAIPTLIGKTVSNVFGSLLPTVGKKIKEFGKSTAQFFKQIPGKIKDSITAGITFLGDKISEGATAVKDKIVGFGTLIKEKILGIPGMLKDAVLAGVTSLFEAVHNVTGVDLKPATDEIINSVTSIVKWPLEKAKAGLNTIKSFLGFDSNKVEEPKTDSLTNPQLASINTETPTEPIANTASSSGLNKEDLSVIKKDPELITSETLQSPELQPIVSKVTAAQDNMPVVKPAKKDLPIAQQQVLAPTPVVKVVSPDQTTIDPAEVQKRINDRNRERLEAHKARQKTPEQPKSINRVRPASLTVQPRPALQEIPLVSNDIGVLILNGSGIID